MVTSSPWESTLPLDSSIAATRHLRGAVLCLAVGRDDAGRCCPVLPWAAQHWHFAVLRCAVLCRAMLFCAALCCAAAGPRLAVPPVHGALPKRKGRYAKRCFFAAASACRSHEHAARRMKCRIMSALSMPYLLTLPHNSSFFPPSFSLPPSLSEPTTFSAPLSLASAQPPPPSPPC